MSCMTMYALLWSKISVNVKILAQIKFKAHLFQNKPSTESELKYDVISSINFLLKNVFDFSSMIRTMKG